MAREEQDREDLLRDATAYTHRAEWSVPFCAEPVFVGFRFPGGPSFYFGQDEVYHFNSAAELRRAFLDGKLLKAETGQLVELTRRRADGQVQLIRRVLEAAEAESILGRFREQLQALRLAIQDGLAGLIGQVLPVDSSGVADAPEGRDASRTVAEMVLAWRPSQQVLGIARSARSG